MAIGHFLQGTYSGRLGDTVGSSWKGTKSWRTMPISVKDAKSEGQIKVRNGFSIISKLASSANDVWLKKYFGKTKKMSAYNLVLKNNKAFFATNPLDYTKLVLPQSYLGQPTPATVAPTLSGSEVSLTLPAAQTLAQGDVTEYLVTVLILQVSPDDPTRVDPFAISQVVSASSTASAVTVQLPITPTNDDGVIVLTQAGSGELTNYSSVYTVQ